MKRAKQERIGRWVIDIVILLSLPLILTHAFGECLPSDSARCAAADSMWLPKLIGLVLGTGLLAMGLGWLANYQSLRLRAEDTNDHYVD